MASNGRELSVTNFCHFVRRAVELKKDRLIMSSRKGEMFSQGFANGQRLAEEVLTGVQLGAEPCGTQVRGL